MSRRYALMRAAAELGGDTGFRDRIALQTFHKLALARPMELLDMVDERTAVMMVVPSWTTSRIRRSRRPRLRNYRRARGASEGGCMWRGGKGTCL